VNERRRSHGNAKLRIARKSSQFNVSHFGTQLVPNAELVPTFERRLTAKETKLKAVVRRLSAYSGGGLPGGSAAASAKESFGNTRTTMQHNTVGECKIAKEAAVEVDHGAVAKPPTLTSGGGGSKTLLSSRLDCSATAFKKNGTAGIRVCVIFFFFFCESGETQIRTPSHSNCEVFYMLIFCFFLF
jgi:hypothetical protein